MTESRMGLMFNAVLKIPMQFFILFTGVLVYVFYLFYPAPVHFKEASTDQLTRSEYRLEYEQLQNEYRSVTDERREIAMAYSAAQADPESARSLSESLTRLDRRSVEVRNEVKDLLVKMDPTTETQDADYVFLTFILTYLPHGLIGLLIAVIFSAAMSSTASELNALASTTAVDFYKRLIAPHAEGKTYFLASRLLTLIWGAIAISFALLAKNSENLIEAVNIVGSIFYGTILGIFLVAFFFKFVKGNSIFYAALLAQLTVFVLHFLATSGVFVLGYLWYNAIGCFITVFLGIILQGFDSIKKEKA